MPINADATLAIDDVTSWLGIVPELAGEFASELVIDALTRRMPDCVDYCNLDWVDDTLREIGSPRGVTERFATSLSRRFKKVRAHHGCRTSRVDSYLNAGIRVLTRGEADDQARSFFLSGRFPEISEARLHRALAGHRHRQPPKVWFQSSRAQLLKGDGHYLLYGSEQILAIAMNLSAEYDYRQALKLVGRPTIFICDVPITQLPEDVVQDHAAILLTTWLEHLVRGRHSFRSYGAFHINGSLSPTDIVSVDHPHLEDIADPYENDRRHFQRAPWQSLR